VLLDSPSMAQRRDEVESGAATRHVARVVDESCVNGTLVPHRDAQARPSSRMSSRHDVRAWRTAFVTSSFTTNAASSYALPNAQSRHALRNNARARRGEARWGSRRWYREIVAGLVSSRASAAARLTASGTVSGTSSA
jgi:hypothetical protein